MESTSTRWSNAITAAISSEDPSSLVRLILNEVENIPYKKKKSFGPNNNEIVRKIVTQMSGLLGHHFLDVDLTSPPRDINDNDWSHIQACRRSDAGSVGIYFVQTLANPKDTAISNPSSSGRSFKPSSQVIVAKPMNLEDFERQVFVHDLAANFFHVNCPAVRLLTKKDAEYHELEQGIRGLFVPLFEELYESGGMEGIISPKFLFSSPAVMLMELVRGKPLCHRLSGQREITDADYSAMGRLFLFDLLIRNTDRFPCRKAMPRAYFLRSDQGNAGNIMFGDEPGAVWAIDANMQTFIGDHSMKDAYVAAFESVVHEIVHRESSMQQYQAISTLFFKPVPGLDGFINTSLDQLSPWSQLSALQLEAVAAILHLIRVRVFADTSGYILARTGGLAPPDSNDEKDWRNWINLAAPRAINDIIEFIEVHTGYQSPPTASSAFESGFLESISAALRYKREIRSRGLHVNITAELATSTASLASGGPHEVSHSHTHTLAHTHIFDSSEMHLIYELIDILSKYEHLLRLREVSWSAKYSSGKGGEGNGDTGNKGAMWGSSVKARSSMSHAATFVTIPRARIHGSGSGSSNVSEGISREVSPLDRKTECSAQTSSSGREEDDVDVVQTIYPSFASSDSIP